MSDTNPGILLLIQWLQPLSMNQKSMDDDYLYNAFWTIFHKH